MASVQKFSPALELLPLYISWIGVYFPGFVAIYLQPEEGYFVVVTVAHFGESVQLVGNLFFQLAGKFGGIHGNGY